MLHQARRTLEPPEPELGNSVRRKAAGEGPEAEEQTRLWAPKRRQAHTQAEVACTPGEGALESAAWPGTVEPEPVGKLRGGVHRCLGAGRF
jgi:hypothetical protein